MKKLFSLLLLLTIMFSTGTLNAGTVLSSFSTSVPPDPLKGENKATLCDFVPLSETFVYAPIETTEEITVDIELAEMPDLADSPESLEKLAANLILAVQWYQTIRPFLISISEQSNSPADNSVIMILDLTLNPLAQTVKELNGIVNAATGSITAEEKAKYTTEASLRVQKATQELQVFLWTLIYKQIDKKQ